MSDIQNESTDAVLDDSERESAPVSAADFTPTPFAESDWEYVGERLKLSDFAPLELSIVDSANVAVDPMFEDFSPEQSDEKRESLWHLPKGESHSVKSTENYSEVDAEKIKQQLEEMYEEGKKAGLEQGHQQAQLEVLEQYEKLELKFAQFNSSLREDVNDFLSRTEKEAVKLSLAVAKKILTTTAQIKPDYIIDVINAGLRSLGATAPLKIRISAEDHEFLQIIGLPPELSEKELGVTYVVDESIKSGCIIDTHYGEVDLEIERMWESVCNEIYEVCK